MIDLKNDLFYNSKESIAILPDGELFIGSKLEQSLSNSITIDDIKLMMSPRNGSNPLPKYWPKYIHVTLELRGKKHFDCYPNVTRTSMHVTANESLLSNRTSN